MSKNGDLIRAGRELIVKHGWIQGSFGSESEGFCAVGALQEAHRIAGIGKDRDFNSLFSAEEVLGRVMNHHTGYVSRWNDTTGRTVEQVLDAFDRAAILADANP